MTLFAMSCSNKVDLYSDDGDTTVVYALLDAYADTNFFKITKSFVGDVSSLAQNYDANNYKYDEIEVTFSGVFEGNNAVQTFTLDTISKWIPYDPEATFYSGCWQRYYYTTRQLVAGNEYELIVHRKADDVNVSAKVKTINSFKLSRPYLNEKINLFSTSPNSKIEWRVLDVATNFQSTAEYFEVTGYFHYKELMPGATDTTSHSIKWSIGEGVASNLYNTSEHAYVMNYTAINFINYLENNTYLINNSPIGVQRWFEQFEFRVDAIGADLYNYLLINNSSSAIQDTPNYSNIENGIGLMSARVSRNTFNTILETARLKIIELYPDFGFINDPNR